MCNVPRAADIPEFVADGAADIGITGLDLIEENDADVGRSGRPQFRTGQSGSGLTRRITHQQPQRDKTRFGGCY